MNRRHFLTVAALVAVLSFPPGARPAPKVQVYEEVNKGLEIGLQGGFSYDLHAPVESAGLGLLTGLEVGYDITWVLRAKAGLMTTHFSGTVTSRRGTTLSMDFEHDLFWGGASLSLLATKRFYAYVQAGAGYLIARPKSVDTFAVGGDNALAILAGGGIEYYPNLRHFSFALEALGMIMPSRGDVSIAIFPVVRYTFGVGKVKVIEPPKDRDGDGVPDNADKCPNQWGPESNSGCPEPDSDSDGVVDREDNCPNEPGPKSNAGCPLSVDTDKDGVPDKLDKCPKEPGPASNEGCPEEDRDGDGVPDRIDKCPDDKGKPEFDGCPTKSQVKVIVKQKGFELREKIHFETNKAIIKRESYPLLDQVAATLKQHMEIAKLQIEGHTDSVGPDNYNLNLSQRRAQAVVDYLVKQGVDAHRLLAKGFGRTKPIASNNTNQGRSMNRRVEMIILEREE
jgi:outer membrane protein OmpA-like peptidoglycan-associated protein